MDENLKRQIENLAPSIDDAPSRVRARKQKSPIALSTMLAIGLVGGIIYASNWNGWGDHLKHQITPPASSITQAPATTPAANQRTNIGEVAEAAKDVYLEQVNTMLRQNTEWGLCEAYKDSESELGNAIREQNCKPSPVAEIEWVDGAVGNSVQRQTVFTDENNRPSGAVNTISMPRPEASQQSTAQRSQPYVTVVEETRLSCGVFREGSAECRRYKQRVYQNWRRACDLNQNQHACTLANRYHPR